jgi:hypothetical protein
VAMVADRLIAPRSRLGFVRAMDEETATSSLGEILDLGKVKEREAYEALDWLLGQQARIENGLARRHSRWHSHRLAGTPRETKPAWNTDAVGAAHDPAEATTASPFSAVTPPREIEALSGPLKVKSWCVWE